MDLIVVESPTKARTLSRFLGSGFDVEATSGHIKDLPKSKLSIDVERNFKPDYQIVEKRLGNISKIKSAAKKSKYIYIATDPDREGEAIASHVDEILHEDGLDGDDKTKRIVFHEITKSAVEEAIKNPRKVDKNLVNAQIARRVLDRLVGYKLSPILWKKVRRGLSAGRVQTVCVRLIVEREREIKAFKSIEYWEFYVDLSRKTSAEKFTAQLTKIGDKKAEIANKEEADKIVSNLKSSAYSVLGVNKKEVRKNPYPPFTTSTMTQAASRLFGWSSKKTMSVAQSLYEEGLITYHRTDSTNMASEAVNKARNYIQSNYGAEYLPEKARFFKTTSKVAQEAHEAIRPTNISSKYEMKNSRYEHGGEKLYGLIWRRFVACQMAASVYDETAIDVLAKSSTVIVVDYLLRASGQIMKFDGWRKLFIKANVKTQEADEVPQLPDVSQGEELNFVKIDAQQKFTQPPPRYTEAALIKTLEKLGIGRPSTYAPTINTIQIRNYVEKNEGKFTPTAIGFAVNDFLIAQFPDVFEYQFTAEMEEGLDKVANGEEKWVDLISNFYKPFDKKLVIVDKKAKRCF